MQWKKKKRKKRVALHTKQSPMNMNDFFFVLEEGKGREEIRLELARREKEDSRRMFIRGGCLRSIEKNLAMIQVAFD